MTPPESLTILSIPKEIPENPYQRLLSSTLRSEGADVLDKKPGLLALLHRRPGQKILHVHWMWLKEGFASRFIRFQRFRLWIWVARHLRWSVVWTVHNWDAHEGSGLETRLRECLLQNCDGLIVHTEATKSDLVAAALPRCPIAVIPHGHYRDAYVEAPSRNEARRRLQVDPSVPIFLAFGQIRPYKGIDRLVKAFRGTDLAATLLIAGACPDA
ncbi:MAG TPA: glycosyltransferase, partial [Planctomycetota bacterium]|nr:glycosyltransferase [Planctomycetota bacterium]